jgi:hypothetical protein
LARLCRDTFLSTWSYPNIFRAERRGSQTISKEVCDLLVVFEDDVLIFSDKDCAFPQDDNLDLSWSRWYRRAVAKSAAQLHGAERVLRGREALFLDAELKHPFPLLLPDPTRMPVHRILVAHGVSDRCPAGARWKRDADDPSGVGRRRPPEITEARRNAVHDREG